MLPHAPVKSATSHGAEAQLLVQRGESAAQWKHNAKPIPKHLEGIMDELCDAVKREGDLFIHLYTRYDKDGDSSISRQEFSAMLSSLRVAPEQSERAAEVDELFDFMDADGNGKLIIQELEAYLDSYNHELIAHESSTSRIGASTSVLINELINSTGRGKGASFYSSVLSILLLSVCGLALVICLPLALTLARGTAIRDLVCNDEEKRHAAIAHLALIPVYTTIFYQLWKMCTNSAIRTLGSLHNTRHNLRTVCVIGYLTTLAQGYAAALECANPELLDYFELYFRLTIAITTLVGWLAALNTVNDTMEHFVAQSNKVFTSSMPQKNWVANMIFSTRWGNKEKDDAYTFKRHDSAAEVLLRVWRVYYFIGGTAAFIVLAGFYLTAVQESSRLESASTGVYELVFYVAVLGSIVMTGTTLPPSAMRNLLYLAIEKPCYLGEVITICRADDVEHNPKEAITGLVENFTMGHVVIRQFGMKQTWVKHSDFERLAVLNWTRRNTRDIYLRLCAKASSEPESVKQFTLFLKQWIKKHPDMSPRAYKKACVVRADPGLLVEIVCYPRVGTDRNAIRQQLILAAMSAATRLGIELVPQNIVMEPTTPAACAVVARRKMGTSVAAAKEDAQNTSAASGPSNGSANLTPPVSLDDLLPKPAS